MHKENFLKILKEAKKISNKKIESENQSYKHFVSKLKSCEKKELKFYDDSLRLLKSDLFVKFKILIIYNKCIIILICRFLEMNPSNFILFSKEVKDPNNKNEILEKNILMKDSNMIDIFHKINIISDIQFNDINSLRNLRNNFSITHPFNLEPKSEEITKSENLFNELQKIKVKLKVTDLVFAKISKEFDNFNNEKNLFIENAKRILKLFLESGNIYSLFIESLFGNYQFHDFVKMVFLSLRNEKNFNSNLNKFLKILIKKIQNEKKNTEGIINILNLLNSFILDIKNIEKKTINLIKKIIFLWKENQHFIGYLYIYNYYNFNEISILISFDCIWKFVLNYDNDFLIFFYNWFLYANSQNPNLVTKDIETYENYLKENKNIKEKWEEYLKKPSENLDYENNAKYRNSLKTSFKEISKVNIDNL